MKNKATGGILSIIGYLLSPLSFWNDIFINIPLAYIFAIPFALISESLFFPAMILFYWVSNILGLIIMHKGVKNILLENKNIYSFKDLYKDLSISIVYTLLIVIVIKIGWLKFPIEYFN